MTQTQQAVSKHDRYFSKAGNVWQVLDVEGEWSKVIRQSYFWEGEWYFPENETPARFASCALLGMQKMDPLGFFC